MFAATLSFLATTPGVWVRVDGFRVPNALGAFLLKGVFLLGAALVTATEALRRRTRGPGDAVPATTSVARARVTAR
jgi:uncharacterized membrane protein YkgB